MDETDEIMMGRFFKKLIPNIIEQLLKEGKIDISRIDDKNYISDIITENIEDAVESTTINTIDYNSFMKGMRSECENGRPKSAVILAGTCIEHILNHFYQGVLTVKYQLSKEDVSKAISAIGLPDKVSWFFKVITDVEFNEELRQDILSINSIRNKVVHYKPTPSDINFNGGSYMKLNEIIATIDFEKIEKTVQDLEKYLEEAENCLNPETLIALSIYEKHF